MSAAFLWQLNRGTDPEKKENHGKAETMKQSKHLGKNHINTYISHLKK